MRMVIALLDADHETALSPISPRNWGGALAGE
jgi:hypothetical protein